MSECDELARRVELGMPTALAFRLPDAQEGLREARELCSSGQPEEGSRLLRQVLDDMHEEA